MLWSSWKNKIDKFLSSIERLGGETSGVLLKNKATAEEVLDVEKKIGCTLPDAFKKVVIEFSKGMEFNWQLPDGFELPEEFSDIFAGDCSWSLNQIPEIDNNRKGWVKECFTNIDDPYDSIWHNKLAFIEVANGDYLSFDLTHDNCPVVYLSHDDGEGHGYVMGNDFVDFMDKWISIGCPGPEDWQIIPFITSPEGGIDPESINAQTWRKMIGV